jgi:uncharacterized protein YegL
MSINISDLNNIFNNASDDGTISKDTRDIVCNNLNDTVIMGCNGMALDDIESTEVTLITALYDKSSSINSPGLKQAVIDGQNEMIKAIEGSKNKDDIMIAQWLFNEGTSVIHSYLPVEEAVKLDNQNYIPQGMTSLYDVLSEAMTANFAYTELLKGSGTPVQNIVLVITDGLDTSSGRIASDVKKISGDLLRTEQYVLAYAGVGGDDHKAIAESVGFPSVIVTGATANEIRKIFQMASQSIVSLSQTKIDPNNKNSFFMV